MTPLTVALTLSEALLCAGLGLTLLRLLRGPSLPDRVVALDLAAVLVVGFVAVHSVRAGVDVFLSAAVVLALLSFLGTVAFARFIERNGGE
jgi:multicomponent Na+:H+ antiporter subunit F